MNKVLLFSDLHIHKHKKSQDRLEDCLKALDWVFEIAKSKNIKNILFGGDLFHDREIIDVFTYQRTFETLNNNLKDSNINIYLLLGNHDLWFNEKTEISSVVPLSSIKGVRIVSKPERLKILNSNWDFIPFTNNPIETLKQLDNLEGDKEYALGHIAVDGAILHGSHYSEVSVEHEGDMVSISPELFKSYKHTFLGHYHAEQKLNEKLEYIGSPLELSFGEAFQEKHLIILDLDSNKKEYIVNDFSPKHLIINSCDIKKYNLKNNFVKVKVDEEIGSIEMISLKKEIQENNSPYTLEIKKIKKKIEEHVITDAKSILLKGDEMLEKYVDQIGTNNLLKDKLISVGKKIRQHQK